MHALDTLKAMVKLPKTDLHAPEIVNKRLCFALLKNPAVTNPLLQFVFPNAAETPTSDLEFAAITAATLFQGFCAAEGSERQTVAACSALLPPGRYVKKVTTKLL